MVVECLEEANMGIILIYLRFSKDVSSDPIPTRK